MKTKGFTLIELLVVIAIISILATMLIPALNDARQMAQNVKCANNLKILSTANHMYAQDNEDFWACQGAADGWMYGVARYWGEFGSGWFGASGQLKTFLEDELVPYFLDSRPALLSSNYGQVTAFTVCPSFRKMDYYENTVEYKNSDAASWWAWGTSYRMTEAIGLMYREGKGDGMRASGVYQPGAAAWLYDRNRNCLNQNIRYSYHGRDYAPNVAYADGHVSVADGYDECVEVEDPWTQFEIWSGIKVR